MPYPCRVIDIHPDGLKLLGCLMYIGLWPGNIKADHSRYTTEVLFYFESHLKHLERASFNRLAMIKSSSTNHYWAVLIDFAFI